MIPSLGLLASWLINARTEKDNRLRYTPLPWGKQVFRHSEDNGGSKFWKIYERLVLSLSDSGIPQHMSLFQWLIRADRSAFVRIQRATGQPVLDFLMLVLRNPYTWIPLYAFLLYFAWSKAKKLFWLFILCSVACVGITDSVTARIFKPLFARPRPCHDPQLQPLIRHLLDCGGWYSFPSNHASNHFGLAACWFGMVWAMTRRTWHWLWIWAALICFAQVYVGKHYPLDVLGGAIFGSAVGLLMAGIFRKAWTSRYKELAPPNSNLPGT
jgi:membrane-associated phospholipid phosphatase